MTMLLCQQHPHPLNFYHFVRNLCQWMTAAATAEWMTTAATAE